ncbi:hypothetical protein QTG56_24145 (plasmid) [Rossellomorea sp. AcN35-11]|nr:hypothetical protein [Rossellomorea aquimaris]WJV31731.1 hypothetical protein QTG56_24145 [Rossellomorea sp. AcN35-11]
MITANQIRTIKKEEILYDELKIVRIGNFGKGAIFSVLAYEKGKEKTIFTGKADNVANHLNQHFDFH